MNYTYDKQRILEVIKKDYEERYGLTLENSEIEIEIKEDGSIEFISNREELDYYVEGCETPPFLSTVIQEEIPQLIDWAIRNKKFLMALYERKTPFEPTKDVGYVFMPVKVDGMFINVEMFAEVNIWTNSITYTDFDSRERVLLVSRIKKIMISDLTKLNEEGEN